MEEQRQHKTEHRSQQTGEQRREPQRDVRRSLAWLTEAQAALGWGVILALVALLGAVYLYQTSRIAGAGREVQGLQNELDDLKRENAGLERQIAEAQSLERLQAEAVRLGFVRAQPEDIEYLVVSDYPQAVGQDGGQFGPATFGPATATPAAAPPEPIQTMDEAIWLALKASLGDLIRGEAP